MSLTFYLGDEVKEYKRKFKELVKYFMNKIGDSSNSAIFRHIVDVLYKQAVKHNKKEVDV